MFKNLLKFELVAVVAALVISSPQANATVLTMDDFEDGTKGNWTTVGANAGLYENGDVVANMAAGDSATNFAPGGDFALYDDRGSGTYLELTDPLLLDSQGYTSVQISFDRIIRNASSTRRLHTLFAADGVTFNSIGSVTFNGSQSYTLNEGPFTFTDLAKFRFTFTDSGGAAGPVFVDNIVIQGFPDFVSAVTVPEPATAGLALLGLGGLMMRRRRMA